MNPLMTCKGSNGWFFFRLSSRHESGYTSCQAAVKQRKKKKGSLLNGLYSFESNETKDKMEKDSSRRTQSHAEEGVSRERKQQAQRISPAAGPQSLPPPLPALQRPPPNALCSVLTEAIRGEVASTAICAFFFSFLTCFVFKQVQHSTRFCIATANQG